MATVKERPISRQACNRCHTAKLRCSREPESQKCARCIKAGVECRYDPPHRLGRPRRTGSIQTCASSSLDIAHSAAMSPDSPLNATAAAEHIVTAADITGANGNAQGLESSPGYHEPTGLDIYGQPTQADEFCLFSHLFSSGSNFDISMSPSPAAESNKGSGGGSPQAIPTPSSTQPLLLSSVDEMSCSDPNIPDDPVLALTHLQVELSNIHSKLAGIKQAHPSRFSDKGKEELLISNDCFKAQLRANIKASEQTLDVLSRINGQPRLNATEMAGLGSLDSSGLPSGDYYHPQDGPSSPAPDPCMAIRDDCGSSNGNSSEFPLDPQGSIVTMHLLCIYLYLLSNFDILVSVMDDQLKEPVGTGFTTPGLASSTTEPTHGPMLDISLGGYSFCSSSARPLQVALTVQLINTLLAKIKSSLQRMASSQTASTPPGAAQNISRREFSYMPQYQAYPTSEPHRLTGCARQPSITSFLTASINSMVWRALKEMDQIDSSLHRKIASIQQWTIEKN
ncbi:hypothetical protein MferCBS31731_007391 [Microsporum ferrugineum]